MAEKGIHCIIHVQTKDLPRSSSRKPSRSVRENFSRVKLNIDVIVSMIFSDEGQRSILMAGTPSHMEVWEPVNPQ